MQGGWWVFEPRMTRMGVMFGCVEAGSSQWSVETLVLLLLCGGRIMAG